MTTRILLVAMLAGALALALAGCGSGGGTDSLRATAQAAGVVVPSSEGSAPAQPITYPTETPDIAPQTFTQPAPPAQVIEVPVEVTRIVPATVEVTREVVQVQQVEVTATPLPTPDIQGFQDSGIDESVQPCPIKFWKRGRCVANDATVEAYANEVQP